MGGEETLRRDLRAAGLRATPARLAVLRLLRASERPLSHGEVSERLAGRPFDRATLYRNLVDLTGAGLARRTELGDRIWRFEDRGVAPSRDHPHFVCTECGRVECLPGVRVRISGARRPVALREQELEVQVRGRCDRCRGS